MNNMNKYDIDNIIKYCDIDTLICIKFINNYFFNKKIICCDFDVQFELDCVLMKSPTFIARVGAGSRSMRLFKFGMEFINNVKPLDNIFSLACFGGNEEIIQILVDKGPRNYNWGLSSACFSDNEELAKKMIELGANDDCYAIEGACQCANLNLIKLLVQRFCKNINYLSSGIKSVLGNCKPNETIDMINNRMEIIKYLVTEYHKFSTDETTCVYMFIHNVFSSGNIIFVNKVLSEYNIDLGTLDDKQLEDCYLHACDSKEIELINMFIDKIHDKSLINFGFLRVCNNGNLNLIKSLYDNGATKINGGLKNACLSGQVDVVNFLVDIGAFKFNKGLYKACQHGHKECADIMIKHGAHEWDKALRFACLGGNLELVNNIIELGATKFDKAVYNACCADNLAIVALLYEKGASITCKFCKRTKEEHLQLIKRMNRYHIICSNIFL